MTERQTKNFIQLLGLGSLVYGIYAVWSEYSVYVGINNDLNAFGRSMGTTIIDDAFLGALGEFGVSLPRMLMTSPYIWAGVILIIAPYLIGLRNRGGAALVQQEDVPDIFHECPRCRQPVRSSASSCPHCGA